MDPTSRMSRYRLWRRTHIYQIEQKVPIRKCWRLPEININIVVGSLKKYFERTYNGKNTLKTNLPVSRLCSSPFLRAAGMVGTRRDRRRNSAGESNWGIRGARTFRSRSGLNLGPSAYRAGGDALTVTTDMTTATATLAKLLVVLAELPSTRRPRSFRRG